MEVPFMDDVQNISAPLYGKAEPTTAKTTMSVREMQHLLGLGKTDSYWLLHKNFFEVILINDKMRIVISSFEKWYANQVKYHKVNGPPPGEELCKRSYSVLEVAEILKVDSDTVYTLVRQGKLKAETVDFWMRIPKEEFERWYRSQSRHRTAADQERDREIEAQTISISEMAKLLGIPREKVYWILDCKKYRDCFVIERVADRQRITKKSFKACVDICILDGVAAVQHFSTAHIDTHMGNARCIVSADEKDQVAGSCVGRGYRGGNIVESLGSQSARIADAALRQHPGHEA